MQMVIAKTGRICNLLFAKSRCPAKTMGARVFAPGGNVALAEEFQMSGGPRDSNNGCGDGEQTNGRSSSRARAAISCHRCFGGPAKADRNNNKEFGLGCVCWAMFTMGEGMTQRRGGQTFFLAQKFLDRGRSC